MAQVRYTEATTLTSRVTSELNSLASGGGPALVSTALSNDASTERATFTNVTVVLAAQAGARTAGDSVSLLVVPAGVADPYSGVAAASAIAANYIARDRTGTAVTWTLDPATTARELTWANVQLPNSDYKVGLINNTTQNLASSGNAIYTSGSFSETYI